jgi:hypothetical protein
MRNMLRVVSVVALLSALAILWPSEPCAGLRMLFPTGPCTPTAFTWLNVALGGVAVEVGLVGLIASFHKAWPGGPIFGARTLLAVSVVTFVSGAAILWPPVPIAGVRALFTASGSNPLNLAYIVWGAIAVLVGLVGLIGVIRAWPSTPIRGR